ncbi:hypothetical protein [Streptomyces sp. FH025]|uniref:hypothetical protein n=1 Tax=Streptomyces sp. FH025 TaxID=2815937 RepID=UPI001A9E8F94|nr:hypothetical protein [Streptomyces sp. FH025]MBO1415051.1 hypothetical protein [Streptomyces sp. FH025]
MARHPFRSPIRRSRRVLTTGALTAAVLATTALPQAGAQPTPAPSGPNVVADAAVPSPDGNLGKGWRTSTDQLITAAGDDTGFHIYRAQENKAFAWDTLATLTAPLPEGGTWSGNLCVTGSGRYAVAVYAPTAAANRAEGVDGGGYAAVVDTTTGQARQIAARVSLAYFAPACGAGERVLLSRYSGPEGRTTEVLAVDAATAKVTSTVRSDQQITNLAPSAKGDFGVADGSVVRIGGDGGTEKVASPAGRVFTLNAAPDGGLDLLSAKEQRAVAEHWTPNGLTGLGDAPLDRLQLFRLGDGRNALVGETGGLKKGAAEAPVALPAEKPVAALSQQGHLAAEDVQPAWVTRAVSFGAGSEADVPQVTARVRAMHSGARITGAVTTNPSAPRLLTDAVGGLEQAPADGPKQAPAAAPMAQTGQDISSWGDVTGGPASANPATEPNWSTPKCAVRRNDPNNQAMQPTPAMVQWAVDRAVTSTLDIQRPKGYLGTGQPAYSIQAMFPEPGIGPNKQKGLVPAQVLLGLVAQESNLSQATWHAVAGDSGNPLMGVYYGNDNLLRTAADAAANRTTPVAINYSKGDCGYGIAQITDGMAAADTKPWTPAQRTAIATDYAANIAAALQMLEDKWEIVRKAGLLPNGGDPRFIENWYLALWIYNSGFYQPGSDPSGYYGLGYRNNPSNPIYPSNRQGFLRASYGDAAKPANWPYQEKVLGWAERPQNDYKGNMAYAQPNFSVLHSLNLPSNYSLFCGSTNHCTPGTGCPALNSSCWYPGPAVSWIDNTSDLNASTQKLAYSASDPEPAMVARYPKPDCALPSGWDAVKTVVVYTQFSPDKNAYGCNGNQEKGGKFTLRTGDNYSHAAYLAQIDLHQFGAGYGGRMYFTHTYSNTTGTQPQYYQYLMKAPQVPINISHRVVATWSPDLPDTAYRIFVHLPSHGAQAPNVPYLIYSGCGANGLVPSVTTLDQSQTKSLGQNWYQLGGAKTILCSGARVQVSNLVDGSDFSGPDIAIDAVAFTP